MKVFKLSGKVPTKHHFIWKGKLAYNPLFTNTEIYGNNTDPGQTDPNGAV